MDEPHIISVLLISDDPAFASSVKSQVKGELDLVVASSMAAVDEIVERSSIKAILLDLEHAGSSGVEAVRSVQRKFGDMPLVVATDRDSDELSLFLLKTGVQEIFVRSTEMPMIRRRIITAIERKANDERVRRQEMHQREDFTAMLAHDLKTPVSGANRIYDLLLEGWLGPLSAGQLDIVNKLKESNLSLLRLIQNMVEVYGFDQAHQSMRLETITLLPLIVDCILHFSDTARRNQIEIKSLLPDTLGNIFADSNAIRRLIMNVLDNAIKFSPHGGTIKVLGSTSATHATITVADQGPGIPRSLQDKLFDRFWQGGPDTKYTAATGLGLYLCKRIVQAHGGTIECRSDDNRGCSFIIRLPLATAQDPGISGSHWGFTHSHDQASEDDPL